MTSLGPVTYRRARYLQRRERGIAGAGRREPGPRRRLPDAAGGRARSADDGSLHGPGSGGVLCEDRRHDAVGEHPAAPTLSMHECWESLGPETLGSIREAEGIPRDATTASVSLDGVMVPLRPGEDGRAKASWREAACGTVSFHDAEGKRLKTLYLGRAGERQAHAEGAACKRSRTHQASTPRDRDRRYRRWRRRQLDLPGDPVARNRGDRLLACLRTLQTASDHAVAPGWFEKYREILRHDPRGVAKVIRALRHLRDAAAAPDRAETERELAFFRKHRHRMRYHALKEEGIAIGSGVVEAANKTLVTQRMKRSGMRWRIVGGQSVLTFRALIRIRPLRAGMEGPDQRNRHTDQRQHQSTCSSHGNRCLNSTNQAPRHHCHARLAPVTERICNKV